MFRVDPASLLFLDITQEDAEILMNLGSQIDQSGRVPDWDTNMYWKAWNRVAGFDDFKRLLVVATVFPAKCFASAAAFYQQRAVAHEAPSAPSRACGSVIDAAIKNWEKQLESHKDAALVSNFEGHRSYHASGEMKAIETFLVDLKAIRAEVQ